VLTPSTAAPSSSRSAPFGPSGVTSVPLARKPVGVGSKGMSLCLTKGMMLLSYYHNFILSFGGP